MRLITSILATALIVLPSVAEAERPASLRGSPASMQEQNRVAKTHGLNFYRTPAEIRRAVEEGVLVELRGNDDYAVADFVSLPFLQPEGVLFVERLARQYREACGQKLVVTSAVRPTNGQPANAHALSVHPAGMAVDLRVSDRAECRSWLEDAILNLERQGVINGIREYRPPHYHIAIYPSQYREYAQERIALEQAAAQAAEAEAEVARLAAAAALERVGDAVSALMVQSGDGQLAGSEEEGRTRPYLALATLAVLLPFGAGYLRRRRR